MPKALTIQRSTVPSAERANYTKRLKTLRSHYAAANCRFEQLRVWQAPGGSGASHYGALFLFENISDTRCRLRGCRRKARRAPARPAQAEQLN